MTFICFLLSLESNIYVHGLYPPLALAQQVSQPAEPEPRPLWLIQHGAHQRARRRTSHVDDGCIIRSGCIAVPDSRGAVEAGGAASGTVEGYTRPGQEPVAVEVEEAPVRPVAAGEEEDDEEDAAVDARAVEEVGADEEEEDEDGGGVCRDEEEREPAEKSLVSP